MCRVVWDGMPIAKVIRKTAIFLQCNLKKIKKRRHSHGDASHFKHMKNFVFLCLFEDRKFIPINLQELRRSELLRELLQRGLLRELLPVWERERLRYWPERGLLRWWPERSPV